MRRITVSWLGVLLLVAACEGDFDAGGPSPAVPAPTPGPPIAAPSDVSRTVPGRVLDAHEFGALDCAV